MCFKQLTCQTKIALPWNQQKKQAPDRKDIEEFEQMVMEGCDANGDGKINRKELTTVLLALAKHASEEEKQLS